MKEHLTKELRDQLDEKYACYVLITCEPPENEGQMHVEMSCAGEPALVSYLLAGAQEMVDEEQNQKDE